MRRLLQTSLLLAGLLGLNVAHAGAVTINFDGLAPDTTVTNQFPEATFSSNVGFEIRTLSRVFAPSTPNFICTGTSAGGSNCSQDVFVSFTNPVNALSFLVVGINSVGTIGLVDIFDASNMLLGTVNIVGEGRTPTPGLVELGAFSNVGKISIRNVTDAYGLGYDDFTFNTDAMAIPEPATLALVGLGLAAAGLSRRRARSLHTRLPRL